MEGGLGAGDPVEDLDGEDGEVVGGGVGQEGDEGERAHGDEWRGFADGAGHGEDVAGEHAAEGVGEDVVSDDLPAGCADGVGGFAH